MPPRPDDGRKQLGSRIPPELLKHLRATAVEQDTSVTDLVIKAVIDLIGEPPKAKPIRDMRKRRRKAEASTEASATAA